MDHLPAPAGGSLPRGTGSLLLPFTAEEEAALARWRATCLANVGTAVEVPDEVRAALARVLAPVDAALHESLLQLRRQERG